MNYQQPGYQQPPRQPYPDQPQYYQQPPTTPPYPGQRYVETPPMQPTKPPKKKPNKWLGVIVGVIIVIVVIAVANSNHGSPNTATSSTPANAATGGSTPASTQPPANQHFHVGDQVTVGSTWKAVVSGVSTDNGGAYYGPKDGNTYLVVDISLTNLSSKEQHISSILNFTLKDSTGQKYNEGIDPNAGATLDGKVEAGGPLRGVIVYEVPLSVKSFTLAFEPDIMASGQTIWDLTLP
jgi:hypothetical protein